MPDDRLMLPRRHYVAVVYAYTAMSLIFALRDEIER